MNLVSEESLGTELIVCRNRTLGEQTEAFGLSDKRLKFFVAFFPICLTVTGVRYTLKYLEIETDLPGYLALSAPILMALYPILIFLIYRRPRKPVLILYERGIRYLRSIVNFDDVVSIRAGRHVSGFESGVRSLYRAVGRSHRQLRQFGSFGDVRDAHSLTVVFKNGDAVVWDQILLRSTSDDLERFFVELERIRPGLRTTS